MIETFRNFRKTHKILPFLCVFYLLFLSSCETGDKKTEIYFRASSRLQKNFSDSQLAQGVSFALAGKLKESSSVFNTLLQNHPQEPCYHILNGLIYEDLALQEGEGAALLNLAGVAYQSALNLEPNNWYALHLMGNYELKNRNYRIAQAYYAQSLVINKENFEAFYRLAASSYYMRDLKTAQWAIHNALRMKPDHAYAQHAAAMIYAAMGFAQKAQYFLEKFQKQNLALSQGAQLSQRVQDWGNIYQKKSRNKGEALQKTPVKKNSENVKLFEKNMVIFDCYFLRVSEDQEGYQGLNILDFLQVALNVNESKCKVASSNIKTFNLKKFDMDGMKDSFSLTAWSDIMQYILNIANAVDRRVEVIGRPSLTTYLNKQASFQSGDQLLAGLKGGISAGDELAHTNIGVHLQITPHKILPHSVIFSIELSASILGDHDQTKSITQQVIKLKKTTINTDLEVNYDDTAMLGGLYQRDESVEKTGFPILQDIPLLKYFFSQEKKSIFTKSILFLVTPRCVSSWDERTQEDLEPNSGMPLKSVRELIADDPFFSQNPHTTHQLLRNISPMYTQFHQGDINLAEESLKQKIDDTFKAFTF